LTNLSLILYNHLLKKCTKCEIKKDNILGDRTRLPLSCCRFHFHGGYLGGKKRRKRDRFIAAILLVQRNKTSFHWSPIERCDRFDFWDDPRVPQMNGNSGVLLWRSVHRSCAIKNQRAWLVVERVVSIAQRERERYLLINSRGR